MHFNRFQEATGRVCVCVCGLVMFLGHSESDMRSLQSLQVVIKSQNYQSIREQNPAKCQDAPHKDVIGPPTEN